MKNIIYLLSILLITITASCSQDPDMPPSNLNKSYTIILDLSDRLVATNQCEKDIQVIKNVFLQFEKQVNSKLTIGSHDAFSVLIIPQRGSKIDVNQMEINLQLDLSKINAADKVTMLNSFKYKLDTTLKSLYQQAYQGTSFYNYFGVDIWEYMNNYSARICNDNRLNNVVILTDGYFDFANNTHVLQKENRFTSTSFLAKLNGANWQQQATASNYGLIPISLGSSCNYIIAGIHSKNETDILEIQKLKYFWNQWLTESGSKNNWIVLDENTMIMSSSIINKLK